MDSATTSDARRFDTLIRGATIVDGRRTPRFRGDVGIRDGRIAAIAPAGLGRRDAGRILEADGLVAAPGFVDLHTHYDAQIQWDPWCSLSGWHGVTSLAIGNCGLGFAPVRPEDRERAMLGMSRVEAIPVEAMRRGMRWDWRTFPEWLDSLERQPKGVNVVSHVPVVPILSWVMGFEEGKGREPSASELGEMCALLEAGLDAGGCGWSVQRLGDGFTSIQRDHDGTPMISDVMSDSTCLAFAEVLRRRGQGHIQITQATGNIHRDMAFCEKLAEVSGCAVLFNVVAANDFHPVQSRRLLEWAEQANARGHAVYLQAMSVGNDLTFTFEDFNFLDGQEDWRAVTLGSVEQRMRRMRDAGLRQRLRDDYDHGRMPVAAGPLRRFRIQRAAKPRNRKWEGLSLSALGAAQGRHPVDAMLDLCLDEDLRTTLHAPAFNTDVELNREICASPYTVPGVSDGGAHTRFTTQGRYPTDFLADFVRDKGLLTLEEAHHRLSDLPARIAGLAHRGVLAEGAPADIVVYDLERLRCMPAEVAHDFPGGAWRRVQKAEGYRYILVNGEVTFADGVCSGSTPGRLLRRLRT